MKKSWTNPSFYPFRNLQEEFHWDLLKEPQEEAQLELHEESQKYLLLLKKMRKEFLKKSRTRSPRSYSLRNLESVYGRIPGILSEIGAVLLEVSEVLGLVLGIS